VKPSAKLVVKVVEEHKWPCVHADVHIHLGRHGDLYGVTNARGQCRFDILHYPPLAYVAVAMDGFRDEVYPIMLGNSITVSICHLRTVRRANLQA